MVSVKNPNVTSQNRLRARAARSRKQGLKAVKDAQLPTRVEKADARRGARAGLLPTSGPNAPLSKKKQKKLEKQIAHAIRRQREEQEKQQELEMKGELPAMNVACRRVRRVFCLLLNITY